MVTGLSHFMEQDKQELATGTRSVECNWHRTAPCLLVYIQKDHPLLSMVTLSVSSTRHS